MKLSQIELDRPAPSYRREAITQVAAELFYSKGFSNTSLAEVAALIGFRKPVIYESFVDKKDLLNSVASSGIEKGLLKLGPAPVVDLSTDELIERLIGVQDVFIHFHKHIVVYIREELNLRPGDARRIRAKRRKFDETLIAWIKSLSCNKLSSVPNVEFAALSISGLITWPVFWFDSRGSFFDSNEITHLSREHIKSVLCL